MIMSDEHSFSAMRCAGNGVVRTPNLDRLAGMSSHFVNAYTTCPVCAPARASWFTGQYVNRIGTWDNSTPFDGSVVGMSSHLKKYGVPTYHFGKTHFHHEGDYEFADGDLFGYMGRPDVGCYFRDQKVGRINAEKRFEKIGLKEKPSFDDRVTDLAIEWLRENKDKEGPWLLNIGLLDPHFPFYVKEENWNYFEQIIKEVPKGTLPPYTSLNEPLEHLRAYFKCEAVEEETIRKVFIGYYAALVELDEKIGRFLDTLEELGLADNTAIIYTSDHGEQMGYHGLWWKCCMFEHSAHIPLMISVPDVAAREIVNPVTLVDIFPTICDVMNIERPTNISGESLISLMKTGKDEKRKDFAFSEYHAHGMPVGMFMIRWDKYKYVHYTGCAEQLFNLEEDPEEDYDLAALGETNEKVRVLLEEGRRRLYEICVPEEVDARAKEYQGRMKKALGLERGYLEEKGTWVPHPENILAI